MKRKIINGLLRVFRYFYKKNVEYYIESQRKQCNAGTHTKLYNTTLIADAHGEKNNIIIGDYSHIKGELLTLGHGGKIRIGDECYIGPNTHLWSGKSIEIGNRVLIGPDCYIFDNDIHPVDAEMRHRQFLDIVSTGQPEWVRLNDKEIVIEDDAWIGANVVILKGVRIGKESIIGAGSVVTHDIPDYVIAHGNPAVISRPIKGH